ncbi:hypothetical protein [Anaerosalibacter massiliensis]|uniref:Uncharacterized protein n=1 Tax=Anaerosalibacter massiliensis TaxID=1347392 RepID=A0A9X2MIA9_9FIRM|nr:hypothetical protein [Anaerosalibacter massiliensis]MCR2044048.1 hypothetical protein [Anaerosalibacter massiliensis]
MENEKNSTSFKYDIRWDQREKVLEVACGCAEFSIEVASIADEIQCIDLDKF